MGTVTIGIDIGQKVDPTALAVVETEWRSLAGKAVVVHLARHVERLPLGTSYPDVAARLGEVISGVYRHVAPTAPLQETVTIDRATGAGRVHRTRVLPTVRLYADATGVGQPVVDLLRQAGLQPVPVYFTHGDRRAVNDDKSITLGKAWLVSRLQALLQTGRILLPDAPEAHALAEELRTYEIRVSEDANDRYGAFRVGAHDDLVTALGLAVQDDGPPAFSAAVGPPRPPLPYGILDDRPARQNRIGDDRALEAMVPPRLRGRGPARW